MGYYEVIFYDGTVTRSRKVYAEDAYAAIDKISARHSVRSVQSVWQRCLHQKTGEDGLVLDEG